MRTRNSWHVYTSSSDTTGGNIIWTQTDCTSSTFDTTAATLHVYSKPRMSRDIEKQWNAFIKSRKIDKTYLRTEDHWDIVDVSIDDLINAIKVDNRTIVDKLPFPVPYSADLSSKSTIKTKDVRTFVDASEKAFNQIIEKVDYFALPRDWRGIIRARNGAEIHVSAHDMRVEDSSARVLYEATDNRAFNRYVNASDTLEEYIAFLGSIGIKQYEFLDLPIELFINWLIVTAAEKDGEPRPADIVIEGHPKLPAPYYNHRCLHCKKFISRMKYVAGINFCNAEHLSAYMAKSGIPTSPKKLLNTSHRSKLRSGNRIPQRAISKNRTHSRVGLETV